jgi:NAD-dependent deacetylase
VALQEEHKDSLDEVASRIRAAASVVVLTGAGISTESGIPDFRGPQGVWTKDPAAEKLSHITHYMADPEIRKRAWQLRLDHPAWTVEPNAGHLALARLEQIGKLDLLITQNIDGLHQKAGSSPERTVEIHGTIREVVCMACDERAPMEKALARVRAGEEDPPCHSCGGILKSATVSFGQSLVPEDLQRAQRGAQKCDVFITAGTSLGVYPVAALPGVALASGSYLAVFNAEPTPYDERAQTVIREPLGSTLTRLVEVVEQSG